MGKGLERETLCPFPRLWGSGTHYETGPGFLLLFMLKSKEEMSCFAEIVLNGRIPYFIGLYFGAPAPNRCETPLFRAQGIKKRYKIFSCIPFSLAETGFEPATSGL